MYGCMYGRMYGLMNVSEYMLIQTKPNQIRMPIFLSVDAKSVAACDRVSITGT